jgi:nucleotide-binding universal stress UspA family protein
MNILIAVDETKESVDAVRTAYRMFGSGADYVVVSIGAQPIHAIPPVPFGQVPRQLIAADVAFAQRSAEAAAQAASDQLPPGAAVETGIGSAGPIVCEIAEEQDTDVVVIGSHDRTIWERLLHSSVGRYIVEHAPCSVLVVR